MYKQLKLSYKFIRNLSSVQVKNNSKSFLRLSTSFNSYSNTSETENNKYQNISYKKYVNYAIVFVTGTGAYLLFKNKIGFNLTTVNAFEKSTLQCGVYKNGLSTYSAEEVSKHDCKKTGIWITYKEGVYDITDFIDKHPGGSEKVMMAAGASIEPFWKIFANHNKTEIYDLLESMRIGNLSKTDVLQQMKNEYDPYLNEPLRHKALKVNGHKPFCAEPPAPVLIENFLTPTELFYVRNHLPVPEVDLQSYTLEVAVEDDVKKIFSFDDLKNCPKHTITSAVMCGGNRRSEMNDFKQVRGLSWGVGAIGNATWTGARLCDILKNLNIDESKYNHVQFEGLDIDPSGKPYSASIPISKALDPRADVLIAYEMNGEPLLQDHGFPARVIVPGVVGARQVKWLSKITLSKEESQSQWQQGDYKGFCPSVDWNNVNYKTSPAIQEMPITSAICIPQNNETVVVKNKKIQAKGYAWSGGGRKIIRVDITIDKGKTWHTANLVAADEKAPEGRHWGWTLWEIDIPVSDKDKEVEIWAKAVDSSYNVQPESFQNIWNLRGLLCNAYHNVKITLRR